MPLLPLLQGGDGKSDRMIQQWLIKVICLLHLDLDFQSILSLMPPQLCSASNPPFCGPGRIPGDNPLPASMKSVLGQGTERSDINPVKRRIHVRTTH